MKKVLILSGPTHEYFDPVRFIGNASSGKMGKAIAEEALKRGMDVEFISGPVPDCNLPDNAQITRVTSTEEMLAAAKEKFATADLIIFAAAVADFQPLEKSAVKLQKAGENLTIELKPTPDIAATLCANKRPDQIAIGFALQTHDGEAKAREKLVSKNLDGIVLNTPATLGSESGLFTWIGFHSTNGREAGAKRQQRNEVERPTLENWGSLNKAACARKIFDRITG
jgi:phosphopantothenoylcysteine decarboxylase / phosphopantothenate---cysteine ligase